MSAQLKSTNQGQTLILTLSDPALRNAMGPAMYAAGIEALNVAETNPDIRSVVITGEGAHFCAGSDVHRLKANREQTAETQAQVIESLHNWMEAIRTFPKPIIAAVEGAAVGTGFSLALMCDLIVAADNSLFATAYSNLGLSPDAGGSWNLARALPRQLASELLLLGERISAQRLQELGIVNRVVDSDAGCECHINLIPHTVENTALGSLRVGSRVNLEIDLIARYVERMLKHTS